MIALDKYRRVANDLQQHNPDLKVIYNVTVINVQNIIGDEMLGGIKSFLKYVYNIDRVLVIKHLDNVYEVRFKI